MSKQTKLPKPRPLVQGPLAAAVIPARLSFLAIYCPELATSEETFADQVLFSWSRAAAREKRRRQRQRHQARERSGGHSEHSRVDDDDEGEDEKNEYEQLHADETLRRVGLCRASLDFARTFSDGEPLELIETEKASHVMAELEPGWWILAVSWF